MDAKTMWEYDYKVMDAIDRAKEGDKDMEELLRRHVVSVVSNAPLEVLVELSEMIKRVFIEVERRRRETQ